MHGSRSAFAVTRGTRRARRHPRPRPGIVRAARAALAAASLLALFAIAAALSGCGTSLAKAEPGKILAVGAENQYANVISQIGGRYVQVSAVMSSPNTDPHAFEASPAVAQEVGRAQLVVQNGLGYDAFMGKIESATAGSDRKVIDVQSLERLPDSTSNPHLWYRPETMPLVAHALVAELVHLQPSHAAYFRANEARFDRSMRPLRVALTRFAHDHPHVAVATTEPVADYLLQAAGVRNLTPPPLQADIMNGTDPAPQAISAQTELLADHRVRTLVYNRQVTDSATEEFLTAAHDAGVPVVGVYETMPTGYDYQSWMLAELRALQRAVADDRSTRTL